VAESGGNGAKSIHSIHRRQRSHQPDNRLGQRARGGQLRLQIAKLLARRQAAVPQQVADFLEGGGSGEVVNVVAAVREYAAIAVEVADR
jgi:hypothetical protein